MGRSRPRAFWTISRSSSASTCDIRSSSRLPNLLMRVSKRSLRRSLLLPCRKYTASDPVQPRKREIPLRDFPLLGTTRQETSPQRHRPPRHCSSADVHRRRRDDSRPRRCGESQFSILWGAIPGSEVTRESFLRADAACKKEHSRGPLPRVLGLPWLSGAPHSNHRDSLEVWGVCLRCSQHD